MDISTIIVSYNTFDLTVKAINSALRSSPELDSEIIVVDNDSPDESGHKLHEFFVGQERQVRIVRLSDNVGFSAANNIGATKASGKVLFFLNPDTIVEAGTLRSLFEFAVGTAVAGAIGPLVLNMDGTVQASVGSYLTAGSMLQHYFPVSAIFTSSASKKEYSPIETCEVDHVKGCAIAMRKDVFEKIGGWDESYFLYAEERELCMASNKLGYKNFFLREASIFHYGAASTKRENYAQQQVIQQRSALQFLERHHSPLLISLNRVLGVLGFGFRSVVFGILAILTRKSNFKMRGSAARGLFVWFVFEYRPNAENHGQGQLKPIVEGGSSVNYLQKR